MKTSGATIIGNID